MISQKRVLLCSVATAALAAMVQPTTAAPWSRGYVVATYEYAFRYGGRAGFERAGEIEPGSDCLHGASLHFANDKNTEAAIKQPFRSKYEIEAISRPPGRQSQHDLASGIAPSPIAPGNVASKPM